MKEGYKIKVEKGDNNKEKVIYIEGDISISTIEKIKKDIENNIDDTNEYKIIVDNVEIIDILFIQLLIATKKYLEKSNKSLTYKLNLNNEMIEVLNNSGLEEFLL